MGRAFSWSLAAHAAFIISFLLLSATRQPLIIQQSARPVRLVTYLEPSAAPRPRAPAPVDTAAARGTPPPAEPRVLRPPAASIPAPAAAPAAPVVAPRVVMPVRGQEATASRTPAAPAEARPALSERLARRLASASPAASRPAEIAPPRIASLPPAEMTAAVPNPDRVVPGTAPPTPEAIAPVGYFPHAWYLTLLKERVFARWSPPSEYFQSSRPPAALVSFRIDRSGGIGGVALKESSGSARFDKSALAAVQGLGQVPALPDQYREETLDVVIRFQNEK
ncbi:MAG: TonB family protein [Candidatus Methylomirabilia bacterium]